MVDERVSVDRGVGLLMLGTQVTVQVYVKLAIGPLPPVIVDVEWCIQCRSDEDADVARFHGA
jgi:hypothetical protein